MKWLAITIVLAACARPSEHRAEAELDVGIAALSDESVTVAGGNGAIRDFTDHKLVVWSNAPVLSIELQLGSTATGDWTIVARNSLFDSVLTADGATIVPRTGDDGPTTATFVVPLGPGTHTLRVAPPDADAPGMFRVAAMADIQTALPDVDDMFKAISEVSDARFVVGMGDITQRGEEDEYAMFDRQLAYLKIPFYTTLGNHELWSPAERFFAYGRASFQFVFKGCAFTFADSGDADIDPLVDSWLKDWFTAARDQPSVFLTHVPPIDPVGVRYGSFRSTRDGERLLGELVDGRVDLTLYGHIHTLVEYENAGIPAYISGGGGAQPMKLDNIDRHFLMVRLDASAPASAGMGGGILDVEVHRVDDPYSY